MAWKKSSAAAVQRFDETVAVEGAKRGLLFGCPIYVLNGERYATLYQDRVVLRLSATDAASSRSREGSRRTASSCLTRSRAIHGRCGRGWARPSPTRAPAERPRARPAPR